MNTRRKRPHPNRSAVTAIAMAFALGLTACSNTPETQADGASGDSGTDPVKWDYFIFVPLNNPVGQQAQEFAEEANKVTNGELEITIRPVGELPYGATDALQAVQSGSVDLAEGHHAFIGNDIPSAGILGLPYFAASVEEAKTTVDAISPYMTEELDKFNVEALYTFSWGPQVIMGNGAPIAGPADFEGKKVRVTNPEQAHLVETYKGFPTTLTTEEVPNAMNTNIVDAIFTSYQSVYGSGWESYIDWVYPTPSSQGQSFVLLNKDSMAQLSGESQEALRKMARDFGPQETQFFADLNNEGLDKLKASESVTVIDVDQAGIEQMTEDMRPFWSSWAEKRGVDDALNAAREALEK